MSNDQLLQYVWDYMSIETPLESADAIIVGGCKNTELARYAAKLYREKLAPLIIFSGHAQPGMTQTEADLQADVARAEGVPESAIIREPHASNTGENITLSAELLNKQGSAPKTIILVHQPFMSRRFLATAEAQWPHPQPTFITRHEETSLEVYSLAHGHKQTAYKTLGDFSRMETYAEQGFQSVQAIPQTVKYAYDTLVSRNYQVR